MNAIFGTITSIVNAARGFFSASGRAGETIAAKPLMQHYGFASNPPEGSTCVILREGINYVSVAEDAGCRVSVAPGQVALYTKNGDNILIDNSGNIVINAASKVTVNAHSIVLGDPDTALPLVNSLVIGWLNTHTHFPPGDSGAAITGTPFVPVVASAVETSAAIAS